MAPPTYPQCDAQIVDDDHGMVSYLPHEAWTTQWDPAYYTENGAHLTRANGASVEFAFTGTAVWAYGDTNADHGEFDVRIDGGEPDRRTGKTPDQRGMQVLFATTVPAGAHRINITTVSNFRPFVIDYFAFVPLPGANPIDAPTPSSPTVGDTNASSSSTPIKPSSTASSGPSTGAVIGIILGVLGVLLFAILGFLIVRDRRRKKENQELGVMPWGYAPVSGAGTPMRGVQQGYMMQAQRQPAPSSGYAYSRRPESYISVEPTLSDFPQSRGASVVGGHTRGPSASASGMPSVSEEQDVLGELPTGAPARGYRFHTDSNDSYSTWAPPDSRYFTSTEGGTNSLGVRSPA